MLYLVLPLIIIFLSSIALSLSFTLIRSDLKMKSPWQAVVSTPFGKVGIKTDNLMIKEIHYVPMDTMLLIPTNELAKEAVKQIEEYVKNPLFVFNLPLMPYGNVHQNKVWKQISDIPIGEVITYGNLSKSIGSAPRAVGQACGKNPYPLVIPCHRVVSATNLGGFGGENSDGYLRNVKKWLLHHEGYLTNK